MAAADMDELSMDGNGEGEVDDDGPQPGNELHPPASRARKTKGTPAPARPRTPRAPRAAKTTRPRTRKPKSS